MFEYISYLVSFSDIPSNTNLLILLYYMYMCMCLFIYIYIYIHLGQWLFNQSSNCSISFLGCLLTCWLNGFYHWSLHLGCDSPPTHSLTHAIEQLFTQDCTHLSPWCSTSLKVQFDTHFNLSSFMNQIPPNLTFSEELVPLPSEMKVSLFWGCSNLALSLGVPLPLCFCICLWFIHLQGTTSKPQLHIH